MRAFVFGLLGVLVGAALVLAVLFGGPLLREQVGGPPRHTADDVLAAFQSAGLRVDNAGPLSAIGGDRYLQSPYAAPRGRTFTVGVVPPVPFYVLEFDSAAATDAARQAFADNRGYLAPRYYVKDNIIFVSNTTNTALVARYETALAGLR